MKIRLAIIALLLSILGTSEINAHPHVWLDVHLTYVFDEKGLAGIRQEWKFDEMFSLMILDNNDTDHNNILDAGEVAKIKAGAFDNLKSFNYFTTIRINGNQFEIKWVTDFSAEVRNDRLVYKFFVPCHITATSAYKSINITVTDETFYTDIALLKKTPEYDYAGKSFETEHTVTPPGTVIMRFKKKR
jgi:ABC-type uncharacterized transport system substrate-binding protein